MTCSTEPSLHDVKRDARELKDVTVEKSEALADDAKARAEYDAGRVKASADSLIDRTKAASHEIKAGAEQGIYSARDKVSHAAEDAKREVQHGAEAVVVIGFVRTYLDFFLSVFDSFFFLCSLQGGSWPAILPILSDFYSSL
ncbi:hypothetical protein M422DRAFT_27256 [Sphaerobolus stellatus SS14]|nr:hypothetical protein M422DRAFT_27256 [Sphaerobolus stellatus SS14]